MGCQSSSAMKLVKPMKSKKNLKEELKGGQEIDTEGSGVEDLDKENITDMEGEESVKKYCLVHINDSEINRTIRNPHIKPFYKEYDLCIHYKQAKNGKKAKNKKIIEELTPYNKLDEIYNGMINQGVTCYMNVSIQGILKLPGLKEYFLNDLHLREFSQRGVVKETITNRLGELFLVYYGNENVILDPFQLQTKIFNQSTLFLDNNQEDAHEFLTYIIDRIAQDLNRIKKNKSLRSVRKKTMIIKEHDKSEITMRVQEELSAQQWGEYLKMNDSIIGDLLLGQFKSSVKCKTCKHSSITFQSGYNLVLEVPDEEEECSLEDCIKYFMKGHELEWFCPKCKKNTEAVKTTELFKLPPVLMIVLKRFRYDPELENYRKVETLVNLDLKGVCLGDYVTSEFFNNTNCVYEPYTFIHHFGDINHGHYTCSIKNDLTNRWILIDDSFEKVIPEEEEDMLNDISNYIIFMKRKDFKQVKRQSLQTSENWPYDKLTLAKAAAKFYDKSLSLVKLATEKEDSATKEGSESERFKIKRLRPGIKVYRKHLLTSSQLPSGSNLDSKRGSFLINENEPTEQESLMANKKNISLNDFLEDDEKSANTSQNTPEKSKDVIGKKLRQADLTTIAKKKARWDKNLKQNEEFESIGQENSGSLFN